MKPTPMSGLTQGRYLFNMPAQPTSLVIFQREIIGDENLAVYAVHPCSTHLSVVKYSLTTIVQ